MDDRESQSDEQMEDVRKQWEAQEIQNALRGLRFGSRHVIVQDGIVVQIDRTEKKRLVKPHSTTSAARTAITHPPANRPWVR